MNSRSDDGTAVGDLHQLADRYVSLWNEPDADTRRKLIRELWAPDGGQVLVQPPEEIRDAAERFRFRIPPLEVHGYDALEARVTRAYEMFVAPGDHTFRLRDASLLLSNVVNLGWTMAPRAGGGTAGGGVDVLALDDDGRIRTDYQFIGV